MVEILCPHCDEEIELDDDSSGVFACPYCDEEFEWNVDPAPSKSGGKVTSNSTFKPLKVEYEFKPAFTLMTAHLRPSESIKVEPGAMVAQSSDLSVSTSRAMSGGLAKGLFKAVMGGESFFLNTYTAGNSGGWISLAPSVPGDICTFDLAPGENLFLQGGAFMACSPNVKVDTKFQGAKSLLSGEGAFFLKAFSQSGSGQVFYNSYGAIKEIEVTPDTPIVVDNGHIVAFTEGVSYRLATEGSGFKNLIFGGEGIILKFSGTGKVWIQSRNLWALAASAPFLAR
jgi:uncharacterized protein (TIGR00266 family)